MPSFKLSYKIKIWIDRLQVTLWEFTTSERLDIRDEKSQGFRPVEYYRHLN